MLAGTMALLAMRTEMPELAITQDEERQFLMRAQNVLRHYSVTTTQKTLDWTAFIGCTLGMAGTRAFAIRQRLIEEGRGHSSERGKVLHFKPRNSRTPPPPADLDAAPFVYTPSTPAGEGGEGGEGF